MSDLVVIYRVSDGQAVSIGSTLPTSTLPPELAVKTFVSPTWEQFSQGGFVWDPVTLTPQVLPTPITIVVSENLRVKLDDRLTKSQEVTIPSLEAADAALDVVRAASISNVGEARTQIRELSRIVEDVVDAVRRDAKAGNCVIKLLLGDYYGQPDIYLQSEAGT